MAKPIFIARFHLPETANKEATTKKIRRILSEQLGWEYHVLVVLHGEDKETKFEVLNADDLPSITKEQFEDIVKEVA